MLVMRQLDNTLKNKDSSFIYTPKGMYFSELTWNNFQNSADKFYIYQHFSIIINIEIYVGGNYYE